MTSTKGGKTYNIFFFIYFGLTAVTHRDNKIKGTLVLKSHYYEALNTLIYAFKTLSPFYYFTNLSLWSSGLAKIFLRDLDKNLKQNKNTTAKQMYWILCCAGICKKRFCQSSWVFVQPFDITSQFRTLAVCEQLSFFKITPYELFIHLIIPSCCFCQLSGHKCVFVILLAPLGQTTNMHHFLVLAFILSIYIVAV